MSLHRLFAITPLIALALALGLAAGAARAQDTSVVGSEGGGGVTIDLSVLDDLDRPVGGGDSLRFPGSQVGPDETVRLQPPGMPVLKRPTPKKKTRRAKRPAPRPQPKPEPPAVTAAAPAEPAPEASAPPRPVTEPPAAPTIARGDVPPPPAEMAAPAEKEQAPKPVPPKMATVPPPPPPPAAAPEMPPVKPAPRTDVGQSALKPAPGTAPASEKAAEADSQTAALPRQSGAFEIGATRAITFDDGSATLPGDAEATLKAAAQALNADPSLRLQIKAYAKGEKNNESKARRLSLSRALGVRSVLIKEGVQPTRIDVRALGNQVPEGPADRVDVTVVAR